MDSKNTANSSTQLRTPHQDLADLSLCPSTPEGVTQWAEQLPVGDTTLLANSINQCLQEILRLKTTPINRLGLLDAITPQCQYIFSKASQKLKSQPITLSLEASTLAALCQKTQMSLSQGYIAVAIQTKPAQLLSLALHKKIPPKTLVTKAIYSALQQLHNGQISAYQAGMAAPKGFWLKAHQLYTLAEQWEIANDSPSPNADNNSAVPIKQMYLGILLLGTSQHYQLRAADIPTLASCLLSWSLQANIDKTKAEQAIVIYPNQDTAPVSQQFLEEENTNDCCYLHIGNILETLENQHKNNTVTTDKNIAPDYLIKHLVLVWGSDVDRTFPRIESQQNLEITFGFTHTHYHVGDGAPFTLYTDKLSDQLLTKKDNQQNKKTNLGNKDPWENPFKMHLEDDFNANSFAESIKSHLKKTDSTLIHSEDDKHPIYNITTLDMSPGGYRVCWKGEAPSTLKPGELIGYREDHHSRWGLAAIRWVRLQDDGSTHFGIEVLSISTRPYVAITSTALESASYRSFLLPEIQLLKQAPALITPQMTFKSKQRLLLLSPDGEHRTVLLKEKTDSTSAYQKFTISFVSLSQPSSVQNQ